MSAADDAAANDQIRIIPDDRTININDNDTARTSERLHQHAGDGEDADSGDDDDEEEEEDEEDDEPRLKYDKCTSRLTNIHRNRDSTSAFLVAGNKLVIGTHNGNIHVLSLPNIQPLRTYQAHSATITSCSISPTPPPPTFVQRSDGAGHSLLSPFISQTRPPISSRKTSTASQKPPKSTPQQQPTLANTPDNAIYVATSSLDGHVCVFSLLDPKDVQLRNFARPVNAVALSPEYKSDRTYLSGGRAGNLILTKGGKAGVSSDANTNSAAAAASGWLGSIGLSSNTGKDSILHQGEGNINTIKWSLSGRWVVWVNEEGIKIIRTHLRLGSEEGENAWRRAGHISRPDNKVWDEMSSVWKAHIQWIDNKALEQDEKEADSTTKLATNGEVHSPQNGVKRHPEKLLVGWGDRAWIFHVSAASAPNTAAAAAKQKVGHVDIIHKLEFEDCVVSGMSLYSPSVLAILAYRTRTDPEQPSSAKKDTDTSRRGRGHKKTGLAPQLRLVSVHDGEELDVDELPMNRFETLTAQDYSLASLWIPPVVAEKTAKDKSALEGLWEVSGGYYAQKMLSSGASVLSRSSSGFEGSNRQTSFTGAGNNAYDVTATPPRERLTDVHPLLQSSGLKLFIQSPYDCVLATKRQHSDHLEWLLQHKKYEQAWLLIENHPEIVSAGNADALSISSDRHGANTPLSRIQGDDSASVSSVRPNTSAAVLEQQRIGELWLTQLTTADKWSEAGSIAAKVLRTGRSWEQWILSFAHAKHFDEIVAHIPTTATDPPVASLAYELVLGHYVKVSPSRVCDLLDSWEEGLFDADAIISAVQNRLASQDIQTGISDQKHLLEALGKLYLSLSSPREALRCYIQAQNAERAFALIQEEKLADALSDDVPGFLTLKLSKDQLQNSSMTELDEATEQAVKILAEEAHKGTVSAASVIEQLQGQGQEYRPLIYFYLRVMWKGLDKDGMPLATRRLFRRSMDEGRAMVEDHADVAVTIFADYDRDLLLEFLEASEVYDYNKAASICEKKSFIPELVVVLSRTGQTRRALELIIAELGDASKAIAFVRQNPDLWDDLLEYGMDKPKFIRGLLAEVGTSIDPVKLIQRMPSKLEIPGLKDGIMSLVHAWELQLEVSKGVDRVLRGEVLAGMNTLREGQRRGLRFEVVHQDEDEVEVSVAAPPAGSDDTLSITASTIAQPGRCVSCGEVFHEDEKQPLLGYPCGHVYHLSCVLGETESGMKRFEQTMASLGYQGTDVDQYHGQSVGAKVAHAHVIRTAVDQGCAVCVDIDGS